MWKMRNFVTEFVYVLVTESRLKKLNLEQGEIIWFME